MCLNITGSLYANISGYAYACRHWEKLENPNIGFIPKLGHAVIAIVEGTPFLGKLAAFIERICLLVTEIFQKKELEKPPIEINAEQLKVEEQKKLIECSKKCFVEHEGPFYVKSEEIAWDQFFSISAGCDLKKHGAESAGKSEGTFGKKNENYAIMGILDSHGRLGGEESLLYAKGRFSKIFEENLNKGRLISECFRITIEQLDKELREKFSGSFGVSGLIAFVDKKSGLVYTATLGDHEANIYRNMSEELKSIPLSRPRNWSHKKEVERSQSWLEERKFDSSGEILPTETSAKGGTERSLRNMSPFSRGIGGLYTANFVSLKPMVTVHKLEKGDLLVLASNGLKTVAAEVEIIEKLKSCEKDKMAQGLLALSEQKRDKSLAHNATVIVLEVI